MSCARQLAFNAAANAIRPPLRVGSGILVSVNADGRGRIVNPGLFRGPAALLPAVCHVVFLRADKQVRGIHAASVVALMADKEPDWHFSKGQAECDSVGQPWESSDVGLPVSVTADTARPLVASSLGVNTNLRKEPRTLGVGQIFGSGNLSQHLRAPRTRRVLGVGRGGSILARLRHFSRKETA